MNSCYVEFQPKDAESLARTRQFVDLMAKAKLAGALGDEGRFSELLRPEEMAFFWHPTEDDQEAWNRHWETTPVATRLSPDMVLPPWDFGSMLDALQNGDYELTGYSEEAGKHYLRFSPYGDPFGGVGPLIALLEAFGNSIVGSDDGTGFSAYSRRETWRP